MAGALGLADGRQDPQLADLAAGGFRMLAKVECGAPASGRAALPGEAYWCLRVFSGAAAARVSWKRPARGWAPQILPQYALTPACLHSLLRNGLLMAPPALNPANLHKAALPPSAPPAYCAKKPFGF